MPAKIFLLSPARCDGRRAKALLSPKAAFPLAIELRTQQGAMLGDVFTFLSGLYFRGKIAYARACAAAAPATIRVITTNRGLLPPEQRVRPSDLESFSCVDLSDAGDAFRAPLLRDAVALASDAPADAEVILLGSIATNKYVGPLMEVFGARLLFPKDFVGRGDMSRGGLMLRNARDNSELEYIPIASAVRHGKRPPKLKPLPRSPRP